MTCTMFDLYKQILMSVMKTLIPAMSMLTAPTLKEAIIVLVSLVILAMEKCAVSFDISSQCDLFQLYKAVSVYNAVFSYTSCNATK